MFKVGDKIVRKKEYISKSYHGTYCGYDGRVLTVTKCDGDYVSYSFGEDTCTAYLDRFELCENKASEAAFDLKTMPWKILVNSPEESRAAQEWLFSQGIEWKVYGKNFTWTDLQVLTNTHQSIGKTQEFLLASDETEIDVPEIKLTFGVTSVEYPEIPVKETEAQKKMKELEDKQREIAEELAKLRESM